MTAQEIIAASHADIGSVGGSFYFTPETLAVGKELGLDGFRWYVLGRGGVLGNVSSDVVTAAFGYFSPALITKLWDSAKEKVAPPDAAARYHLCAAEHGRRTFDGVADLDAYCAAAQKVIAAADRDGLSLFAGWAPMPLVDDAPGRAMQLTAVLRELRGSAHLAAVVATGLRARTAHFLKRPDDAKTFGYTPEDVVSEPGDQKLLDAAETATDVMMRRPFSVLTDGEGRALVAGAAALKTRLG